METTGPHCIRLEDGRVYVMEGNGVTEVDSSSGARLKTHAEWQLMDCPLVVREWYAEFWRLLNESRVEQPGADQWFQEYEAVHKGFRYRWRNDNKDPGTQLLWVRRD